MSQTEIELGPTDLITIGFIGNTFYLQIIKDLQVSILEIEKLQLYVFLNAIREILNEAGIKYDDVIYDNIDKQNSEEFGHLEPLFHITNIGIGSDGEGKVFHLSAQELATNEKPPRAISLLVSSYHLQMLLASGSSFAM
jgi:hypothetical protein